MQTGADVNVVAGGATPLDAAAHIGNSEILHCLLKAGADPNVIDEVKPSKSSNFIHFFG